LFCSLFDTIATDSFFACAGRIAHVARLKLAVGIASVAVDGVAVVALLVASLNLVTTVCSTRRADSRTHIACFQLASAAAPVAVDCVAVVTRLAAGHLLVAAFGDIHTGLALVRAEPAVLDLVASRRAAIAAYGVAVVADLAGLVDNTIAAVRNDGRGPTGITATGVKPRSRTACAWNERGNRRAAVSASPRTARAASSNPVCVYHGRRRTSHHGTHAKNKDSRP
jgi:hypothetical protein